MTSTREPQSEIEGLSVSIVVYRPDLPLLRSTLQSVALACEALRVARPAFALRVLLVDNGGLPDIEPSLAMLRTHGIACEIIRGQGNVGYGLGHNLAIERTSCSFHLVLNPDVELDPQALVQAFAFFDAHHEAGLLTPRIGDEAGQLQYLCRRYPTLVDLFVRGFLPARFRRHFARRLARYEMRDVINDRDTVWDPQIVSGCFMLFRAKVLHHGGGAARKGSAHIRMFVSSAYKFFNRFGWKWR